MRNLERRTGGRGWWPWKQDGHLYCDNEPRNGSENGKNLHASIPHAVLAEAEKFAAAQHVSMDEFTHTAMKHYMEELGWKEFYAYGRQQARNLGIKQEDVERIVHEYREEERAGKYADLDRP